jgi:Zn-dependent protease with chaperone function
MNFFSRISFRRLGVLGLLAAGMIVGGGDASAKVPYVDTVVGKAVDAVLALASASRLEVVAPFHRLDPTPAEKARLDGALVRVRYASQYQNRYQDLQRLILIQGIGSEPNAFATGLNIYISRGMLKTLTDAELTAVIAHEMGHSERGHLVERMGNSFAGVLVHLASTISADWTYLTSGRADEMMEDLIRSGHWATLSAALQLAETGQEMQADCIAWKWLAQAEGSPYIKGATRGDLLGALEHLLGVDEKLLRAEPLFGPRVSALASHGYDSGSCL